MIIDLFSHIGPRKGEFYKVESLLELEDQAGVDKVMICSQLETIDNGYIFDCTQRYPDRTLGFGVINPWDMDGEEELERCFRDYNFYGVKMNPIRFGYSADRKSLLGPFFELCSKYGKCMVVHGMSDMFSGRENGGIPQDEATLPGPISAYGSTKLMGEKYVEQFCHRHFIVRTAWLYSYYGKNFVKTIVNAGKKFGKLEVVNDQCGNPTNAADLAHAARMIFQMSAQLISRSPSFSLVPLSAAQTQTFSSAVFQPVPAFPVWRSLFRFSVGAHRRRSAHQGYCRLRCSRRRCPPR